MDVLVLKRVRGDKMVLKGLKGNDGRLLKGLKGRDGTEGVNARYSEQWHSCSYEGFDNDGDGEAARKILK